MRIKSVGLTWFRGAADLVTLEANGKSMVVYGKNGAGKSSFVDAIEYLINNGKLEHLAHEYSGRNQRNAILNTHIPEDKCAELCLEFIDRNKIVVEINHNGAHTVSGADSIDMKSWEYRRTVLRQDEVATFICSTKGEKYSSLLPLFGLQKLEVAAENLHQLQRAVSTHSNIAQMQSDLRRIQVRRKQFFDDLSDADVEAQIIELRKAYLPDSTTEDVLSVCKELHAEIVERISALTVDHSRYSTIREIAGVDIAGYVKAVRDANAKLADAVMPLIQEKLDVLQAAGAYVDKLTDESEIECPACGQFIAVEQFSAHVSAEQELLKDIIAVNGERKIAVSDLVDGIKKVKSKIDGEVLSTWRNSLIQQGLGGSIGWIDGCDPESFRQALSEDDLEDIENNCLPIIKAGNDALQDAPPGFAEIAQAKDKVEVGKEIFEDSTRLFVEVSKIQGLISFISTTEEGVRAEIRGQCEVVIGEIAKDVSDMWEILYPRAPIDNIHLYLPENDKAIDIALRFHGKDQDSPRLTLSEGFRNSLGLCIFLAMAKREAQSDRPLILDDVVVSLDRDHRGMIAALLESHFSERQVIIFTHDRSWYADLRVQFDQGKWVCKSLLPYVDPVTGIRWSHRESGFDDARENLVDMPDTAANMARKIMDVELALVAEKLKLKLPYMRGEKNDTRMALEFLTRIKSDGKACFKKVIDGEAKEYSEAIDIVDQTARLLITWGNRGSHSTDVVDSEAAKLIDQCESALDLFRCDECEKNLWVAEVPGKWMQCECGALRWRYDKC